MCVCVCLVDILFDAARGGGCADAVAVYEYPDYVQLMSFPFDVRVACTTSLQDEMVVAAKAGFCPTRSAQHQQPCAFQFTANCFDNHEPPVCRRRVSGCYFRFRFHFYLLSSVL